MFSHLLRWGLWGWEETHSEADPAPGRGTGAKSKAPPTLLHLPSGRQLTWLCLQQLQDFLYLIVNVSYAWGWGGLGGNRYVKLPKAPTFLGSPSLPHTHPGVQQSPWIWGSQEPLNTYRATQRVTPIAPPQLELWEGRTPAISFPEFPAPSSVPGIGDKFPPQKARLHRHLLIASLISPPCS